MMARKTAYLLSIIFLLAPAAHVYAQGCVTSQCHPTVLRGKNVHPVAEPCETCHKAGETPHPQKGRKTFSLVQEQPALCATCHPPFGKKPQVHSPVKDGVCTTCHNPHSSDEPKLLGKPVKDLCLMCHPDKMKYNYLHGPTAAGNCTGCHNPHESGNKGLLVKDMSEVCITCHFDMQDVMKKKDVHPALFSGCTSCHNPHGSPYKKLLSAEGEQLCFQCHPKIAERIEKSKVVHTPVKSGKNCATCHSPHATDTAKLLFKTGKDLCLDCHKDIIKKGMTVLHGPIKDGSCVPCHDPHASPNANLLPQAFSSDTYIPYTDKEYTLCFTCHNRDLLRYPDTSFATGFRNGERNLHYLHVNNKVKGRNCKLCHNVHGSQNPKLVAESALFGKWELPLKFVKTETGGSCSPGCHQTYSYDRKTPTKVPEPPKPPQEKEPEPKQ
jgi:predicted CXXCH cytochrome family protein